MNDSKLSIKHACAAGAAFLGLLSAAAITAAFLFTRNSTIVWLGLLFILLVFACAALFVAFLHRKLVLFSDNLCQTIDDMLNGAAAPQVCEEENLFYKINHRLVRLYEVMWENQESIVKERADLQELISDISHQVKNANQQSKNGKCHAAGTTHARGKAAGVFAGFQRPARKAGFSHAGHDKDLPPGNRCYFIGQKDTAAL